NEASPENPGGNENKVTPCLQPLASVSEPSLSRQRRQKKREQAEVSSEKFRAVAPRPLPFPPHVNVKTRCRNTDKHIAEFAKSGNSSKNHEIIVSKDRPLSARERRRLKQSQEEMFPSVSATRRASHSAVVEAKSHTGNHHVKVTQSSSEPSICQLDLPTFQLILGG
uniref:Uncharacterized protein n=1 Tax=Sphenodon punctatus TaxID=8508 RepID=A0A8D0G7V3_SPHPU